METKTRNSLISIIAIFIASIALVCTLGCAKASTSMAGDWVYEGGGWTYHFNDDNTGNYMGSMEFTYKLDGNKIEIHFDGKDNVTEGTVENNKLTIVDIAGKDVVYNKK